MLTTQMVILNYPGGMMIEYVPMALFTMLCVMLIIMITIPIDDNDDKGEK